MRKHRCIKLNILIFILSTFFFLPQTASEEEKLEKDDEWAMKCDACKIIVHKFSASFKTAEEEMGGERLKEVEYIEAAEATCDDEWTGYGVRIIDGVQRLAGDGSPVEKDAANTVFDSIWERRLQDMCDDLLAEAPDEKTLYNLWVSGDEAALHEYLCLGEGLFKACVPGQDFGGWPGDDYDDMDEEDFGYPHDEF